MTEYVPTCVPESEGGQCRSVVTVFYIISANHQNINYTAQMVVGACVGQPLLTDCSLVSFSDDLEDTLSAT